MRNLPPGPDFGFPEFAKALMFRETTEALREDVGRFLDRVPIEFLVDLSAGVAEVFKHVGLAFEAWGEARLEVLKWTADTLVSVAKLSAEKWIAMQQWKAETIANVALWTVEQWDKAKDWTADRIAEMADWAEETWHASLHWAQDKFDAIARFGSAALETALTVVDDVNDAVGEFAQDVYVDVMTTAVGIGSWLSFPVPNLIKAGAGVAVDAVGASIVVANAIGSTVSAGQGSLFINGSAPDTVTLTGHGNTVIGSALGLDADEVIGFSAGNKIGILGVDLNYSDLVVEQGSAILKIDTTGDGSHDTVIRLAGAFDLSAFRLKIGSTGTIVEYPLIEGTGGSDTLAGTVSDDIIKGYLGDDIISANEGNDVLLGGGGHDSLRGEDGNDVLSGDAGDDTLDGGNGNDTVSYAEATGRVVVRLAQASDIGSGQGVDTFVNIENVTGSRFNDRLVGDAQDNILTGGGGNDVLIGLAGDDRLDGGDGDDDMTGSGGNDTLLGGNGDDRLFGLGGADVFDGGRGNDLIEGGLGVDTIDGGIGDDDIFGFFGIDTIHGGNGFDNIRGDGSGDIITGGGGNDRIVGGNGKDILWGGAGNDVLFGGGGNASGDGLRDVFVFKSAANGGGGFDIIRDFEDTKDKLDLSDSAYTSFTDVLADAVQSGAHVEIDFDGSGILRIENLYLADFTAGDMIF